MKPLFVSSTAEYSGKSLFCIGIGLKLKAEGYRVGYFKPLGRFPEMIEGVLADKDAQIMKEVLGLDEPLTDLCPVLLTQDLKINLYRGLKEDFNRKVREAYEKIAADKDVLLLGGAGQLTDGTALGVSNVSLAASLDASVLLIDRYDDNYQEVCVDGILAAREMLGERVRGVVLNKIPRGYVEFAKETVVPFLEKEGLPVLGVIPFEPTFQSISVGGVLETVGGRLVLGEDKLGEMVESFSIGAMDMDSALKYFRRKRNKAVITGGNRPDIIVAAMETSTACIILTGGMLPNEVVLGKIREKGIPLIVVPNDTLTTIGQLESVLGRMRISGRMKIDRCSELIEKYFDYEAFKERFGIAR
jgi:BioD-like phosphotransacetylase family protein